MPKLDAVILKGSLSRLMDDIDDFCGTRPPRRLPPRGLDLRDALAAAAIQNLAGMIGDAKLRSQIQRLAGQAYSNAGRAMARQE